MRKTCDSSVLRYPPLRVEQHTAELDMRLPLQVSRCSNFKQAMLSARPYDLKRSLGSRQGEKLHEDKACRSSSSGLSMHS